MTLPATTARGVALAALLLVAAGIGCDGPREPPDGEGPGGSAMAATSKADLLRRQIVAGWSDDAEATAARIGEEADPVLLELAGHDQASVKKTLLGVASVCRTKGASRAVLALLSDGDESIRGLARDLLGIVTQEEVRPDLHAALGRHEEPAVRGALALQLGRVGDARSLALLRQCLAEARDPGLVHDIELAMARLGDEEKRWGLVARLMADEAGIRLRALRDSEYVADPALARHFGSALSDHRDVVDLSEPDDPSLGWARVCDVAVQVLHRLGHDPGFDATFLERRSDQEIEKARLVVNRVSGD
jgi:hypothetical protein